MLGLCGMCQIMGFILAMALRYHLRVHQAFTETFTFMPSTRNRLCLHINNHPSKAAYLTHHSTRAFAVVTRLPRAMYRDLLLLILSRAVRTSYLDFLLLLAGSALPSVFPLHFLYECLLIPRASGF